MSSPETPPSGNEPPEGQQAPEPQTPPNPDDNAWDEAAAKRKFERMKADLDKARNRVRELEPAAAEAEKRRKGELSEAQRLAEEKAELERKVAELSAVTVRRDAAEAANLPAKFAKFITATDAAEAPEQAKELAAELKQNEAGNGGGNGTRRPDFRQGSRGPANNAGATPTANELIRRMAGHA